MTYIDFLEEMQNYFGINMKVQQQAVTEQFIEQYDERDLQEIPPCSKPVRPFQESPISRKPPTKPKFKRGPMRSEADASDVTDTTWLQLIIKDPNTGFTSNAVETCTCFPRKIKDHPDKLVGYIPIRDAVPF